VHQLPARCLVDVLGSGDQPGTAGLDLEQHVGVVTPVASEAIDLPQDDVVDVAPFADAGQHLFQCRSVVSLGRLCTLDILADDLGTQFSSSFGALLALALDGQAVVAVVSQLPPRGHPQIQRRLSQLCCFTFFHTYSFIYLLSNIFHPY